MSLKNLSRESEGVIITQLMQIEAILRTIVAIEVTKTGMSLEQYEKIAQTAGDASAVTVSQAVNLMRTRKEETT